VEAGCLDVARASYCSSMRYRLLAEVPEEDVQRLLAVARRRRFDRGEVVFHQEDPADSLHLIVSGRFAVRVMTPLGDSATIGVRGPGESFGEMALVSEGARRAATVGALEPAETFAVYQDDFHRLRREHRSIDGLLIDFLASEVRLLNGRLLEALYLPAEQRVRRRLGELAATYCDGEAPVEIPLTQEELANLAGTSRATVNRVLREEQERGTLELTRGRTVLVDLTAIAARRRL
jgi:CRP/FNR family transcriptional regulator, cyclic AMP receptor protein